MKKILKESVKKCFELCSKEICLGQYMEKYLETTLKESLYEFLQDSLEEFLPESPKAIMRESLQGSCRTLRISEKKILKKSYKNCHWNSQSNSLINLWWTSLICRATSGRFLEETTVILVENSEVISGEIFDEGRYSKEIVEEMFGGFTNFRLRSLIAVLEVSVNDFLKKIIVF